MGENQKFVQQFSDRTIQFSIKIIRMCDSFPRSISAQVIARQIIRSATSIGANFVEGQATNTRREFTNFMTIALKSAKETLYWLTLIQKANIVKPDEAQPLFVECDELSRMLGSIVKKLRV